MSSKRPLTNFEIQIVEVSKLSLKSGDILALKIDSQADDETVAVIFDQMKKLVPDGVKIAVIPSTADFQIITPS